MNPFFLAPRSPYFPLMPKLEVTQLTHRFGRQTVLHNLSLETSASIFGISGSNGSGKSTLMRCLAGLLKPTGGSVRWTFENETCSGPDILGRIGFAAPYVELYEGMSPEENLLFLSNARRNGPPSSIKELIRHFQIEPFSAKPYGDLSTGQRQRVKLAAALLHDPEVICLDEPGANLDLDGRELIQQTVQQSADQGKMILIASNQPEELALCQDQLNLDQKIVKPTT